ncbi:hypothetical protein [Parasphingopyxis marina]|uniref:Uncharacterized protein n=1 Tax=Parasphingopyxis marina TaxID=2761622 RepID=A0A842HYW7_9SPHN|nr:hypothetical protein [Parasphingopyxis marina]MBC2778035.1 hypothetical protein [Parasphingopyxis marina]
MFYKANKALIYATMGLSVASMGSAAMADVLVTRSSGAAARQYPRGTRLDDNQVIVLGAGDSITILTSRGTRQYSRPGRYPLSGPRLAASNGVGFTNAIARTGVSRTGEPVSTPATWQIEIGMSGPFCIAQGQPVSFWRYDTEGAASYTVTRLVDSSSATVAFSAGENQSAWPSSFVPHNGTYRVEGPGGYNAQEIVITSLAVDLTDPVAVGAALLENGCDEQLSAFATENESEAGDAS